MVGPEEILEILNENIDTEKYFVVDIKASNSKIRNKITVLVDSDEGIQIDECGEISRALGLLLDEKIDQAYTLEVSSPGVDTPLKLKRQYLKNIGRQLKVIMKNSTEVTGELLAISEEHVSVLPEKKKKEKVAPEVQNIIFEDIKEAKVMVSFK